MARHARRRRFRWWVPLSALCGTGAAVLVAVQLTTSAGSTAAGPAAPAPAPAAAIPAGLGTSTTAPPTSTTAPPTSTTAPPTTSTAAPTPTRPTSTTAPPTTTRPAARPGCQVTYRVRSRWDDGFVAEVVIGNTGTSTVRGWTLTWAFAGRQRITNAWNARVAQAGRSVSARNAPWNATITPGASTGFGFQARVDGRNASPAGFQVNGIACERP